jgi:hypothetical protein
MTRGWVLSPGIPLLLAVIGTAALAYSWYLQSGELVRASDYMARLERTQFIIENDELSLDQWLIALDQELAKPAPNEEIVTVAAHKEYEENLRLISHMKERVAVSGAEKQQIIDMRTALENRANKLAESKDYKTLLNAIRELVRSGKDMNTIENLDQQYSQSLEEAHNRIAVLERQVRFYYFCATGLLLLSSLLASVFLELTLRKVAEQNLQFRAFSPAKRR